MVPARRRGRELCCCTSDCFSNSQFKDCSGIMFGEIQSSGSVPPVHEQPAWNCLCAVCLRQAACRVRSSAKLEKMAQIFHAGHLQTRNSQQTRIQWASAGHTRCLVFESFHGVPQEESVSPSRNSREQKSQSRAKSHQGSLSQSHSEIEDWPKSKGFQQEINRGCP